MRHSLAPSQIKRSIENDSQPSPKRSLKSKKPSTLEPRPVFVLLNTPKQVSAHMTQSSVSTARQTNQKVVTNQVEIRQESFNKSNVTSNNKNTPKVSLRRVGSSQWLSSNHTNNTIATRKDTAAFLHFEIDKITKQNERIKVELNKKAGEVRILRTWKAEAERNISKLVKEIRSFRGQLGVKNMEIKNAERKLVSSSLNRIQPDPPNRLGTSTSRSLQRDSLERELTRSMMAAKSQALPLRFLRDSVLPDLFEPSQPEAPVTVSVRPSNPGLFSGVLGAEGSGGTKSQSLTRTELLPSHTSISSCAALLLSPGLVDITSDYTQQVISQMVDICHNILCELLKQLESASCSNNRFIERERELLMLGARQLPLDREYDLISHRELYRDERGISARRALGLMSLLLQASNFTARKILSSSPTESTEVLDTVRNIVQQIEKQRRTLMFQGVLAGSVSLIMNLLKSETSISEETQLVVVDVLRWVVLSRPGSLVVRNVLQTLLAAAGFPLIVDSLCHNSAKKTCVENRRQSIIQFTPDSCVLQVLCCVVKAAETPRKHRLTDLLTRWALSLFCNGRTAPWWLTTVSTATNCQCYSLLRSLCFSLVSEACFAYPTASADDCQLLEQVLAHGVVLVKIFLYEDEQLLAIAPHSQGCYKHFLHFMSDAKKRHKITLNANIKGFLGFLCKQEEVLKKPSSATAEGQNAQLPVHANFNLFKVGDHGQNRPNVNNTLDSL